MLTCADFLFVPQVLSFIAFVLEETVDSCFTCSPLYFFEFVSCTAFLFTLLLLVLLSTKLHEKIHIEAWPTVVRTWRSCFSLSSPLAGERSPSVKPSLNLNRFMFI